METALVIGIAFGAAACLFWLFRRSLTGDKTECSCGRGCSCADPTCSGQDLFSGPDCCDEAFDEAKYDASSSGKIPRGHFCTGALRKAAAVTHGTRGAITAGTAVGGVLRAAHSSSPLNAPRPLVP